MSFCPEKGRSHFLPFGVISVKMEVYSQIAHRLAVFSLKKIKIYIYIYNFLIELSNKLMEVKLNNGHYA